MATYREIHGKAVKTVTTNPTDTAAEGQIWFNSTDSNFKSVLVNEAWSSSSNAITVMHAGQGFGGQSDAVGAGGYGPGLSPAYSNATDEYNGSGWKHWKC